MPHIKLSKPFIVAFEGVDYSGKSTLATEVTEELVDLGYPVWTDRFPGSELARRWSTLTADEVRSSIIQTPNTGDAPSRKARKLLIEMMQAWNTMLGQDTNHVYILDRSWVSTIVYQLDMYPYSAASLLASLMPIDYVVLATANYATLMERKLARGATDCMETEDRDLIQERGQKYSLATSLLTGCYIDTGAPLEPTVKNLTQGLIDAISQFVVKE